MTNNIPESDNFTKLEEVGDEMRRLDVLEDRTQAAYGYISLIERVAGSGPALEEGPGMMTQEGATNMLTALQERLQKIESSELNEEIEEYTAFVAERVAKALSAPYKAAERERQIREGEPFGTWTGS